MHDGRVQSGFDAFGQVTELSTIRAAGLSPNDTFDTPSVVCTEGQRRLTSRMASMVSIPSRRASSCPVAIGERQGVHHDVLDRIPQFVVRSSMSRSATLTFHAAVLAWPSRRWSARSPRRAREPVASWDPRRRPVPVLVVDRVPRCVRASRSRPASITSGSVESSTIGSVDAVAIPGWPARPCRPRRPGPHRSKHRSSRCAPSLI